MATLAEIQAILHSTEVPDGKLILIMILLAASITTLKTELAAAMLHGVGHPVAMDAIVAQMAADIAALNAAAIGLATPPSAPVIG